MLKPRVYSNASYWDLSGTSLSSISCTTHPCTSYIFFLKRILDMLGAQSDKKTYITKERYEFLMAVNFEVINFRDFYYAIWYMRTKALA